VRLSHVTVRVFLLKHSLHSFHSIYSQATVRIELRSKQRRLARLFTGLSAPSFSVKPIDGSR
jgi:hypothetical protein